MPRVCVICDGCGEELSVATKFYSQARRVATEGGWDCAPDRPFPSLLPDPKAPDYCPKCRKPRDQARKVAERKAAHKARRQKPRSR